MRLRKKVCLGYRGKKGDMSAFSREELSGRIGQSVGGDDDLEKMAAVTSSTKKILIITCLGKTTQISRKIFEALNSSRMLTHSVYVFAAQWKFHSGTTSDAAVASTKLRVLSNNWSSIKVLEVDKHKSNNRNYCFTVCLY